MKKSATTHKKWLENHGQWAHFTHRDVMRRKKPMARAMLPEAVPATALPVDCTGNASVSCPMDANNTLGICGPAMCDHVNGIRTFGQGKAGFTEVHANLAALEAQYERVSGGDNGTDEDMLVGSGGIWMTGIAGDPTCIVVDHLDVNVTNIALTQYCIDQFYAVCMAWSVPDDFINGFAQGTSWLNADTPDPNNGHYTPLADVDASGSYRLWTWGAWCWAGPKFVASVEPESFVTFSPLQFSKATGYDSHGRHVSDQASKWITLGGNATAVHAVVAQFPAVAPTPPAPTPPAPTPAPSPTTGVTLSQAIAWGRAGINNAAWLMTRNEADVAFAAGLTKHWPK